MKLIKFKPLLVFHLIQFLLETKSCQTNFKESYCPSGCEVKREMEDFKQKSILQLNEASQVINECREFLNQESYEMESDKTTKRMELRELETSTFDLYQKTRLIKNEILVLKERANLENLKIVELQQQISHQHRVLLEIGAEAIEFRQTLIKTSKVKGPDNMLSVTQRCEGHNCNALQTFKGNQCRITEAYQYPSLPDCAGLYKAGQNVSGVYLIRPRPSRRSFKVYCNMDEEGGGWTVIQRRVDGAVDFDRNWEDYKYGFAQHGNLCTGEFWLGNKKLVHLTKTFQTVRFKLTNWENEVRIAQYMYFKVNEESSNFMLQISVYDEAVSNATDSISGRNYPDAIRRSINNMHFTTRDNDNDRLEHGNCALLASPPLDRGRKEATRSSGSGGWWYNKCHSANPNGKYYQGGNYTTAFSKNDFTNDGQGIVWSSWLGKSYSLKHVEIMLRPYNYNRTFYYK